MVSKDSVQKLNILLKKGDDLSKNGQIEKAIKCYYDYAVNVEYDQKVLPKLVRNLAISGQILKVLDLYFLIAAKYPKQINQGNLFNFSQNLFHFLRYNSDCYEFIYDSLERIYEISNHPDAVLNILSDMNLRNGDINKAANLNSIAAFERVVKIKKLQVKLTNKSSFISNRTPDFLIIGPQKSATSALYKYIVRNPNIFPALKKEIFFFSRDFLHQHGLDYYKSFFPSIDNYSYLTGEASATYFNNAKVAKRIAEALPGIKLVFILRNPAERAISDYYMKLRAGKESRTLLEAISSEIDFITKEKNIETLGHKYSTFHKGYVRNGIYTYFLKKYTQLFPKKQYIFVRAEELKKTPQKTMNNIFSFLNVDSCRQKYLLVNVGSYSNEEQDYHIAYTKLIDFYRPFNQELEELTGLNFESI